jgi:hypothetical protein
LTNNTTAQPPWRSKARAIYTRTPWLSWDKIGERAGCSRMQAMEACADLPGATRGQGRKPDYERRAEASRLHRHLKDLSLVAKAMGLKSRQAAHYLIANRDGDIIARASVGERINSLARAYGLTQREVREIVGRQQGAAD